MTNNKALESSASLKTPSIKKTSRPRKATPKVDAPVAAPVPEEVALASEGSVESTARASKPKTPPAKSTAVTHRHKKFENAPVEIELRAEPSAPVKAQPVEPAQEEIAKLAYSYYVDRGYQPGNPADDWFRATAELRARLNP